MQGKVIGILGGMRPEATLNCFKNYLEHTGPFGFRSSAAPDGSRLAYKVVGKKDTSILLYP